MHRQGGWSVKPVVSTKTVTAIYVVTCINPKKLGKILPFRIQTTRKWNKFLGVTTSGGEGNEQRANRIFAELDINGDGEVTREEFVRGCMQDKDLVRMLSAGGIDNDEMEFE